MTRYSEHLLEEIRGRLPLQDVIGRIDGVQMQKTQKGFICTCPFPDHADDTPSFAIFTDNNTYKCFGASCGKNGDIFTFYMQYHGMTFPEAVKTAASEAGVKLKEQGDDQGPTTKRLYAVNEAAAHYFHRSLLNAEDGPAHVEIRRRALSKASVKTWQLGVVGQNGFDYINHLQDKGFTTQEMIGAGLATCKNGKLVPFFYSRLMIPIRNAAGKIVAFSGRALSKSSIKYLNTRETVLFDKAGTLYGSDKLKSDSKDCIIVEGFFDVIQMSQANISNTVAPMGTSLTEKHLRYLWTRFPEPILMYDGDNGGKQAIRRTVKAAFSYLRPGKSLRVCRLLQDQDPDSIIRNFGRETVQDLIDTSDDLMTALIGVVNADVFNGDDNHSNSDPAKTALYHQQMINVVDSIEDPITKAHFQAAALRHLQKRFGLLDLMMKEPFKLQDLLDLDHSRISIS